MASSVVGPPALCVPARSRCSMASFLENDWNVNPAEDATERSRWQEMPLSLLPSVVAATAKQAKSRWQIVEAQPKRLNRTGGRTERTLDGDGVETRSSDAHRARLLYFASLRFHLTNCKQNGLNEPIPLFKWLFFTSRSRARTLDGRLRTG